MIQRVITLLAHDLAVAVKNKTLFLVIGIPLFVCGTLTLVDPIDLTPPRPSVALLSDETYSPAVRDALAAATGQLSVSWVSGQAQATHLLKDKAVAGILTPDPLEPLRLRLTVVQQTSVDTVTLVQGLSALQAVSEQRSLPWIATIASLQSGLIKQQTLPTWILMMVLLVAFVVLPTQVAEEKEKQLLMAWLQTPVRETEWLAAKLLYGMVLMLISVTALHVMVGGTNCADVIGYLAVLCAGGICFGAVGVCLGLLCRSQASARTLGVLCYLPLLLPAALSDMSEPLRKLAPLILSYQFHSPMRAMLLDSGRLGSFVFEALYLIGVGLLFCFASHRLIKRRWLMS